MDTCFRAMRLPQEEEENVVLSFMDFSAALGHKAVCKPDGPENFQF